MVAIRLSNWSAEEGRQVPPGLSFVLSLEPFPRGVGIGFHQDVRPRCALGVGYDEGEGSVISSLPFGIGLNCEWDCCCGCSGVGQWWALGWCRRLFDPAGVLTGRF